jgi:hypothetical protein
MPVHGAAPDEIALVEALAAGEDVEAIRARLGWPVDKMKRYLRSAQVAQAVSCYSIQLLHSRTIPRAIRMCEQLLEGVLYYNIPGKESEPVLVKPETRLAAAQAILKLAKYEDHRPDDPKAATSGEKTLAEMDLDEMIARRDALEAQIASQAAPLDAPMDPDGDTQADEKDSLASMLE